MFFFTYIDATASKNEMKIFQNFFGHSETGGEYAKKRLGSWLVQPRFMKSSLRVIKSRRRICQMSAPTNP